ncbi:Protein CBG26717 [Caenorhabditis briggsae]|nr:Protein CBG26717 [Caenorhabditis briggsae]CAS01152.1 Protein CBG26717 [Caenorhabditis briggsae]
MDTLQIINKTLEYFGHDYFGNEPNRSTKVSHRKKVVLRVLYNSLLKIPAGPFVNGFKLSYLAGKMMERRDNLLRWFKRRRFEDTENKLRFSQMAHLEKFTSRTSSFGTPESSTNVTDFSRRTSFSGEDFSDELEESRCQKTGEILENSETTPPCYINGNVQTSCNECFKKSKLYKLLKDSDDSF